MNGQVNAIDYEAIDNGFNMGLVGWQNGDFNGDGKINGDDYTMIDNAFNTQGSVSFADGSAGPTEMIASVPEPMSTALISVGLIGLLGGRRRRCQ